MSAFLSTVKMSESLDQAVATFVIRLLRSVLTSVKIGCSSSINPRVDELT